jgi:hypothetical protein
VLSLSGTLKAAQQAYDVEPLVSALVGDVPPEVPRLSELTPMYNGSEPDAPFEACFTAAGTIGRAYLGGGTLYVQVVAPPGNQTAWSSWTALDASAGNWAGTQQVALAGSASDGIITTYWVAADGHTIRWAQWNGSAWGSVQTLVDAGVGFLVSGLAASGLDPTPRLFYIIAGGAAYETHLVSGPNTWSAPVGDGGRYSSPMIGADYLSAPAPGGAGDWYVLICAGSPTAISVERFNVTSGLAGWQGAPAALLSAGVGTGYSYAYPRLAEARIDCLRAVVSWSETAPSPIGTAAQIAFTPTQSAVLGVVPWRYVATHGVRVFHDLASPAYWWILTSNQAYRALADSASNPGARVLFDQDAIVELEVDLTGINRPGRGTLIVLNEGGALKDAGIPGQIHQALRQWSQVAVSLGYHGSAGDEVVWQAPLWIEGIVFHDEVEGEQPLVTLHLVDGWGILDLVRARSTITYTNQTVDYILQRILWHVCGSLSLTGNARLTGLTLASFTIRAGESLGDVARRLCDLGAVALVFRSLASSADGTGWDSVGIAAVNRATGASAYSYGPSGGSQHPVLQSEFEPMAVPSATGVEVAGSSTYSEVRNWTPTWLLWRDLRSSVVDKTLDTQDKTDSVAGYLAQLLVPEAVSGAITVLANVGQELADQVDVTIATAPVNGMVCSVSGILTSYHQRDGRILQTIALEGSN